MRTSILLLVGMLIGCATTTRPAEEIASRFQYKISVERGVPDATDGNQIEVVEVWGTRPKIEVGGEYVVMGRYTLAARADKKANGSVTFFLTASNWNNSGPVMDLQRSQVNTGEGTFVLQHKLEGPGRLHVSLHDAKDRVANLYFGPDETGRSTDGKRVVQGR